KAGGELAIASLSQHYLIRTSWVVGQGRNFVDTMRKLARSGVSPRVVNDQTGRLTFADELARASAHLLEQGAPYGTYHVTNSGQAATWADIASWVFAQEGRDASDVIPVSTAEYYGDELRTAAPRPASSLLDITRLCDTGFTPMTQKFGLEEHLRQDAT
ncbi:MAG: sugar nucleotide-binding protein, partial [Ornithinimicrobium sp.]